MMLTEKEMLLRLNAIFRRISKNSADTANTGLWRIGNDSLRRDNSSHTFFLNENKITLTLSEWKILSELTENAGILITRTKLLEKCLNFQAGYERVIDTHIKNIRSKLGQEWIETVRGYGYKFIGEKAK